jgi:hypothetical protein
MSSLERGGLCAATALGAPTRGERLAVSTAALRLNLRRLIVRACATTIFVLAGISAALAQAAPGARPPAPAPTPQAAAAADLTGYWVSLIDDEWRWRMLTPAKGDFSFVPVNAEARRIANNWDPAKDEAEGNACRAFGAAGILHLPTRLHITWADDRTLEIDTDAGTQKRLLHFDHSQWTGGEPNWQGDSVATWEKQAQAQGFGIAPRTPPVPGGGSLKVVTTHMKPGYLRKNGIPYSGNALLTEYFDRIEYDGTSYLIVTGIVEDPQYLTGRFITSEQFKQEPDGSKWKPTPCQVAPPAAPFHPNGF